jgi:hypothetical protein
MEKKLIREVRLLRGYTLTVTIALALFIVFSFTRNTRPHFEEIDVERINIVERNGQLKMVISNKEKQHPGMINGQLLPPRERPAGLLFFNSSGDECGGLGYDGNNEGASMNFAMDQFKNDQIVQLFYNQNRQSDSTNRRSYGLRIWDRSDDFPLDKVLRIIDSLKQLNNDSIYNAVLQEMAAKGQLGAERCFTGKNTNREVGLFINDTLGKPRIKLYLDRQNNPHLEFLDTNGQLITVKKKEISN